MADRSLEPIDVDRLRVGVFVHFDPSVPGDPAPSDGVLIRDEAHLAEIRALGLRRVHWSPSRSTAKPLPEPGVVPSWAAMGVPLRDPAVDQTGHSIGEVDRDPGAASATPPDVAATGSAAIEPTRHDDVAVDEPIPAESGADGRASAAARRAQLADQQASLDRCEHQFSEASRQLRSVLQNARANPTQARQVAMAQVDAMVGHVDGMQDVAIRLLSEKAGQETTLHAMNVSVLSILLGRALKFDAAQLAQLGLGALLHDVGKLELPDRLRWRDDHAPAVERRLFQGHAGHGVALAKKMGLAQDAIDIIAQHHEFADGGGYPAGLRGEQIRPLSRVVALVNQYDNLCNAGNPAQSLTPHDALAMIFARQRDAFDATVLAAFIRMMGVYPPGSVLQLNDERYAIVVSVNSERPLKPRIVIHDPEVPADEALVVDLERHPAIGIQRAVKPLQLPRAVFDYLSPRKRMCYFFERSMAARREASG